MGNCTPCGGTNSTNELSGDPFEFVYGEDKAYLDRPHYDSIPCSAPAITDIIKQAQQQLQQSKKLYKDPSQTTEPIILKSVQGGEHEIRCTYERPFRWLRDVKQPPYRIMNREKSGASDVLVADEAFQYFGVFLCFLAQHPELIEKVIVTGDNSYGLYAVQMTINNQVEYVYIDDYVLCQEQRPLFSQPVDHTYIWPCLIEKAWLKVKGHMARKIHKIWPRQVFQTFLHYPMKTHTLSGSNRQEDRKLMASYIDQLGQYEGCLVTTKQVPEHKIGISGAGHYFLIRKFFFQNKHFYYLRNPCGSFDFRGAHELKEESELMQHIKQETGSSPAPGNFVLDEQEFIEQVNNFTIVHYDLKSQVSTEKQVTFQEDEVYARLRVENDAQLAINFRQTSNGASHSQFSPVTFHVISLTHHQILSDLSNDEGCFGVYSTNLLDGVSRLLRRGEYLIRIKKKSNKRGKAASKADKIVVLGPQRVQISIEQHQQGRQLFYRFLKEQGKKRLLNLSGRQDLIHIGYWLGDIAVIYVEKFNPDRKAQKLEVGFAELQNLQCLNQPVERGYRSVDFTQEDLLFVFEKIDLPAATTLGHYSLDSY